MDHEVHGRQEREVRVDEGVESTTSDGAALAMRSHLAVVAQGDRRDARSRTNPLGSDGEHV